MAYLARSNPRRFQNNIWWFLITVVIFVLTWVSLSLKQTPREVYSLSKITESYFHSEDIYRQYNTDNENLDGTVFY